MKQMTTTEKIAIDTNVLIYVHDESEYYKKQVAVNLMKNKPTISSQVISEYLNVLKRKLKVPKIEIVEHCQKLLTISDLIHVDEQILQKTKHLIQKYDFQIFDAVIVAAALEARCTVLYSEDMQHDLLVENQLLILNPFL